MNTSVLKKCVEELKKDQPDIRYILGMLETFIELSDIPPITNKVYRDEFSISSPKFIEVADKVDE